MDSTFDSSTFDGRARLFPLPNLVMFPHVLQPLHVFEPRYREMVTDALAADRLLAMAVLTPGWEGDYHGRPPLFPVACLGRIATCQRLPDGRYNLLLQGLRRVQLLSEIEPPRAYRQARVELLDDVYPHETAPQRPALQRRLNDMFKQLMQQVPSAAESLDDLSGSEIPLGTLTDIVAYTLPLDLELKQRLLRETNVDHRAALLIDHFDSPSTSSPPPDTFPPNFSLN